VYYLFYVIFLGKYMVFIFVCLKLTELSLSALMLLVGQQEGISPMKIFSNSLQIGQLYKSQKY